MKIFCCQALIVILTLSSQISARVYVPHIENKHPEMDFMTRFSDNLNNDLLTNTVSMGINDSNKALKAAGLTLQNKIINKEEMDTEGRRLVQEYDSALTNTQKVEQEAEKKGFAERGNWGERSPEERQLTQVVVPQQPQPVMMTQPQYFYNQIPQNVQPMYTVAQTPNLIPSQVVPVQSVMSPVKSEVKAEVKTEVKTDQTPETVSEKKSLKVEENKKEKTVEEPKKVDKLAWAKKKKGRKLRRRRRRRRWGWRRPPLQYKKNRRIPRGSRPGKFEPSYNHPHSPYYQRRITHRQKERDNHKKVYYGHFYHHNPHRVNTRQFHLHNKRYYKNRYHHIYNKYYIYYKKVRGIKNMNLKKALFVSKLRKAKLAAISREKFDNKREEMVKSAAEKWNRTFIYDAVLMEERRLYDEHKKMVKERMDNAEEQEEEATRDIEEFYNKYFGKDSDEIKAEDLVHHIFL